jgi:hypothetical protein
MATGIVTEQEIRAIFAQKLQRRFQAMMPRRESGCICKPARQGDHEKPCPGYYWERASRVTELLLAEEEGALDANG